jgi:hypothetical protein
MEKGAKVAIGCAIALFVVVLGVVVAGFGAAWWAKGQVEQMAGDHDRIEGLRDQANANAFTRPADDVIQEDRLKAFLEVRKRVYSVYEQYKGRIETAGRKDAPDLGDVTKALSIVNDIRLAQAEALADVGMSEAEYSFLVEQVYRTLWAAQVAEAAGGESVSEATDRAIDEMTRQLEDARQRQDLTEEARHALEQSIEQMKSHAEQARGAARQMDVPEQNIELFRRHEAEIKKYAMSGLELIGL